MLFQNFPELWFPVERKSPLKTIYSEKKTFWVVLEIKVFNMSLWTSELASSAIQIYYFPSIEAPVAHPTRLGYRLVSMVTFSVIFVACKLEVIRVINLLYHLSPQQFLTWCYHRMTIWITNFYIVVLLVDTCILCGNGKALLCNWLVYYLTD